MTTQEPQSTQHASAPEPIDAVEHVGRGAAVRELREAYAHSFAPGIEPRRQQPTHEDHRGWMSLGENAGEAMRVVADTAEERCPRADHANPERSGGHDGVRASREIGCSSGIVGIARDNAAMTRLSGGLLQRDAAAPVARR